MPRNTQKPNNFQLSSLFAMLFEYIHSYSNIFLIVLYYLLSIKFIIYEIELRLKSKKFLSACSSLSGDKNWHLLKHSSSNNHHRNWLDDFKILGQATSRTSKERSVKLFSSKERNLTSMFKKMPTHWSYTIDVTTFQYQAPDDVNNKVHKIK